MGERKIVQHLTARCFEGTASLGNNSSLLEYVAVSVPDTEYTDSSPPARLGKAHCDSVWRPNALCQSGSLCPAPLLPLCFGSAPQPCDPRGAGRPRAAAAAARLRFRFRATRGGAGPGARRDESGAGPLAVRRWPRGWGAGGLFAPLTRVSSQGVAAAAPA